MAAKCCSTDERSPLPCLVTTFVLLAGLVIYIVAFSLPHWTDDGERLHEGLWKTCTYQGNCTAVTGKPGWFTANQAVACFALISYLLVPVSCLLYGFAPGNDRFYKFAKLVIMVLTFIFVSAVMLTYGINMKQLGYCFYLLVLADVFPLIGIKMTSSWVQRIPRTVRDNRHLIYSLD